MTAKLAAAMLVTLAAHAGPAFACMGPTVLLADNFQKADPAWVVAPFLFPADLNPSVSVLAVADGYANLTPPVGVYALANHSGDFPSADVCVDVRSPAVADPAQAAAGIGFGLRAPARDQFYVFAAQEDGQAAVFHYRVAEFNTKVLNYLVPWRAAPALKQGGNATNTLRVSWKGTSATAFINGQPFATFTIPNLANTTIGIWGEGDPGVNSITGATWRFSNLKVTNVP